MSEFALFQTGVIVIGIIWAIVIIRCMGGNNPFTTRLCETCREIINDRAKICPCCHTVTGKI